VTDQVRIRESLSFLFLFRFLHYENYAVSVLIVFALTLSGLGPVLCAGERLAQWLAHRPVTAPFAGAMRSGL
jgi:hypothetical protein